MNKRKEPISTRVEKKVKKEVHKSMKKAASTPRAKEELDAIAKMHPKKTTKTTKELKGVSETVARKKVYAHKKLSKRTSPEDKIENSSPAHIHTENERWMATSRKQSVLKGKRLTKKLSHRTKRPAV